jgi:N-acetylmuramoyl-L-alanine amidase
MGKYIISVGHTASGNIGCGAADLLDESNCTREIAPLVVEYLQKEGHEAHLLRIDKSNSYNCEDCYVRADQANAIGGDLFVEIHLNSGKERTGDGTEVCVNSVNGTAAVYAQRIVDRLSGALNIDNRGLKEERLIVLRRTDMPAILVECMFVDANNVNNYDPDIIAKAIAEGILDQDINTKPVKGWNKSQDGTKWWYCTDVDNYCYYKSQWVQIDGKWYLFDSIGFAVIGWIAQNDKWYYLDPVGCDMAIGWEQINGYWYFFNSDGEMQTGWIKDNGKDYCLYSSGAMIHDCDLYGYRFDSSGAAVKLS